MEKSELTLLFTECDVEGYRVNKVCHECILLHLKGSLRLRVEGPEPLLSRRPPLGEYRKVSLIRYV